MFLFIECHTLLIYINVYPSITAFPLKLIKYLFHCQLYTRDVESVLQLVNVEIDLTEEGVNWC